MSITGYYYLHINGDLIYKRYLDDGQEADFRDSDFVKAFWPFDAENREHAWNICVESLALGANHKRVIELAKKWFCDDEDADIYTERLGLKIDKNEIFDLFQTFVTKHNYKHEGRGETKLEAIANLLKSLGFKKSKTWGYNSTREWLLKNASN